MWGLRYIRCCSNCGSLFVDRNGLLCAFCWQWAELDRCQKTFIIQGPSLSIQGRAVWDWIPDKNDALSSYLSGIKGLTDRKVWSFLAQEIADLAPPQRESTLLVPAPSLRSSRSDHAFLLCQALAKLLVIETLPLLEKTDQRSQRGRARIERQKIAIRRRENFSQLDLSSRKVILIDDIVTTGQTCQHSFEAIGQSKSQEIWCLAHRALL